MTATPPSRVVVWLQYAAAALGWWPSRCVGCRDMRFIRTGRRACRACRRDPDTAAYATWLNTVKRWNRERTR